MAQFVEFDSYNQYMKGYRIRIYPTDNQIQQINRCIELNLAIYNWTIEKEKNQYELFKSGKSDKKFLSYFDLVKLFTTFRYENPWLNDMPYGSGSKSIKRAYDAFQMFFKGKTKFPKFKSKKHIRKFSYSVRSDTMYFDDNMLRIEGFARGEKIYTKWHSGFKIHDRKYYNPVITKDCMNRYFVSFCLLEHKPLPNNFSPKEIYSNPIGIDLNIKDRFVCSNGYRSGSPDLRNLIKKQKRLNRKCQKDFDRQRKQARSKSVDYSSIESSNRAKKRLNKYRKVLEKISNVVENFIQTETAKIIKMDPSIIIMEDLVVSDMERNHYIAQKTHRSNLGRCIEVMKNKCNKFNIPFKFAAKNFPSSQLCSRCGNRQKIGSKKIYICPNCGLIIDRDDNAANNLKNLAFV